MRPFLPLLSALLCACAATSPEERAHALAQRFLIVDGHVDVPYRLHAQQQRGEPIDDVGARTAGGDFDFPRAQAGGLDAPFFSIYTPAELEAEGRSKEVADELLGMCAELIARHPQRFELARTAADVRRIAAAGRIALLYGMENGSPLEGELANLDHFFDLGVRYITLTHGQDNHLCDSSYDTRRTHQGLSAFGREVVKRMNALGMLIDVSHLSDDAFWDVLELTRAPVIASHSSLRHFTPGFERNLSDEMVRAVARNGGVVMVNFGSSFLTTAANGWFARYRQATEAFAAEHGGPDSPEAQAHAERWRQENPFPFASVADVADHIDRAVQLAGVEHVGLGSDFDGVGDSLPTGLKDVSMYPNLLAELLRRGYRARDIEKICGANVLRVMEACERLARASGPPAGV
ncbi:MAG TPA: dipeptidase [Planctomycetota bacterium]